MILFYLELDRVNRVQLRDGLTIADSRKELRPADRSFRFGLENNIRAFCRNILWPSGRINIKADITGA